MGYIDWNKDEEMSLVMINLSSICKFCGYLNQSNW